MHFQENSCIIVGLDMRRSGRLPCERGISVEYVRQTGEAKTAFSYVPGEGPLRWGNPGFRQERFETHGAV